MTKWIERYRREAEDRFRRLDVLLEQMGGQPATGTPPRGSIVSTPTTATRRRSWRTRPARHPDHPGVRRTAGARVPGVHRARSGRPVARPAAAHDAHRPVRRPQRWLLSLRASRDDGSEYGFHGVFHEVRPDERIVQTFTYEGEPDGVAWRRPSKTSAAAPGSGKSLMDSIEARDSMLRSGMDHGVREGLERLDELLDRQQSDTPAARTAADEHRPSPVFTERVRGVPPDAWDNPAPCEGWAARDVVRHLVEWFPAS